MLYQEALVVIWSYFMFLVSIPANLHLQDNQELSQ